MSKLAIATDFSEQSDLAVKTGKQLLDILKAEGTYICWDAITARIKNMDFLPNVEDIYRNVPEWGSQIPAHYEKDFQEQLKRTGFSLKDIKVNFLEGSEFQVVDDYLDGMKDPLLVVSASKKDYLSKLLFGSFIEKAVFRTNHNVFLAKKEITNNIRKVGVCFDPIQDNEKIFDHAIDFAKKCGADIDIIHVQSFDSREIYKNVFLTDVDAEANKNKLIGEERRKTTEKFERYKKKVEDAGLKSKLELVITVDKTPAENLIKHLKEDPVDVIFVEPHPGFMKSFRFNSTSYDLIKHVPTNFFIIKEV